MHVDTLRNWRGIDDRVSVGVVTHAFAFVIKHKLHNVNVSHEHGSDHEKRHAERDKSRQHYKRVYDENHDAVCAENFAEVFFHIRKAGFKRAEILFLSPDDHFGDNARRKRQTKRDKYDGANKRKCECKHADNREKQFRNAVNRKEYRNIRNHCDYRMEKRVLGAQRKVFQYITQKSVRHIAAHEIADNVGNRGIAKRHRKPYEKRNHNDGYPESRRRVRGVHKVDYRVIKGFTACDNLRKRRLSP